AARCLPAQTKAKAGPAWRNTCLRFLLSRRSSWKADAFIPASVVMSEGAGGTVGAGVTVTVLLPRALLALFPDAEREVRVSACCVDDVINALEARWAGMRDRLCDSSPRVRRHINIVVEGRRAGLDTPLQDGAKVYVLTAI